MFVHVHTYVHQKGITNAVFTYVYGTPCQMSMLNDIAENKDRTTQYRTGLLTVSEY